jgi:hypothetical protein
MKKIEREKATELRKKGKSVGDIAKELGVARSSAFEWTKNIKLTEEQKTLLYGNRGTYFKSGLAAAAWSEKWKKKRLRDEDFGKLEVDRKNWEHAAGCMLWWAEGDKSRSVVALTNCDYKLLRFFVIFLKKYYNVKDEDFAISVQYHGDLDEVKLGDYWKTILNIPGSKVQKGYKKEKKSSETKWPNGVCRIRINRTELASRLWGSVQEYIGFNSPDGLIGKKKKISA